MKPASLIINLELVRIVPPPPDEVRRHAHQPRPQQEAGRHVEGEAVGARRPRHILSYIIYQYRSEYNILHNI